MHKDQQMTSYFCNTFFKSPKESPKNSYYEQGIYIPSKKKRDKSKLKLKVRFKWSFSTFNLSSKYVFFMS
jgi:hypothetical protein